MTSYIKPHNYEKMKQRKSRQFVGRAENMAYRPETGEYIYKNGKRLKPVGTNVTKNKTGYSFRITVYACGSRAGCNYRADCTKAREGNRKRLYISRDFQQYRRQTLKNIANETGKPLRMNRSIQVEGAFGAIKRDHSFRRFLTRGQEKVKIEFLLLNISCNVNKLHNKRERNRVQEYLHRNGLIA